MRNRELTRPAPLLNKYGCLNRCGWARTPLLSYSRDMVAAPKIRIKEWDNYIILSEKFGCSLMISDNGYVGLQSVSLLDFTAPSVETRTILTPLPMGKLNMPQSSLSENTAYHDKNIRMVFEPGDGYRRVCCKYNNFKPGENFICDLTLYTPQADSLAIAIPFENDPRAFFYNHKINCMRADGYMKLGTKVYEFHPERDFATLDWGRGVWPYNSRMFWCSGNAIVGGKSFGFNLGYGFGDTTGASENIVYYAGRGHKLDDVRFHIPATGYTDKWKISSSNGRFEADFAPVIDSASKVDACVVMTDMHRVFGKMSGFAVLDDGTTIKFHDLMCFAEDVKNRY